MSNALQIKNDEAIVSHSERPQQTPQTPKNKLLGVTIHAHQLKDGYKTKFCSFELKSPQMEGFIKNKHAK
ncbi:hypothetical protein COJ60_30275 [Bacillus cereus]|uniref:hypothetical protein n=1 Tax=Bacillus TaxID=1386 RepID=UPI000BF95C6F|nr:MULTISPECIES: hypothetical protein [Bacillus cereus group]PFN28782.1 hypothetical protein COJ60_30275 [Bacillus cereus]MCU5209281.1 hypothetical protein [Bacillus paranthracis]MDA2162562.1 hypothetical protein [Bacillus cereus group sp. Bc252]MDF9513549.1 hypothetical protein [Bacillus paranthracis]MDF9671299.1 hypothetical protein [Bacillus paranthracis]